MEPRPCAIALALAIDTYICVRYNIIERSSWVSWSCDIFLPRGSSVFLKKNVPPAAVDSQNDLESKAILANTWLATECRGRMNSRGSVQWSDGQVTGMLCQRHRTKTSLINHLCGVQHRVSFRKDVLRRHTKSDQHNSTVELESSCSSWERWRNYFNHKFHYNRRLSREPCRVSKIRSVTHNKIRQLSGCCTTHGLWLC